MIYKGEDKKIAAAYQLLRQHGILCYVPGCFDIVNQDEAVLFAQDKDAFYRFKEMQ